MTTEQVLLLNNLVYMDVPPLTGVESFSGKTVGEWINSIDLNKISSDVDYGIFTSGEEWINVINSVKNDPELMNMRIAETHRDDFSSDPALSVIFTGDGGQGSKEAVVVFRGTEGDAEWRDNFEGAYSTGTERQEAALKWYTDAYDRNDLSQYEVTVSGHSKGGNKAKYVTIMSPLVDNCLSFDGQGFSDEFISEHSDLIALRQGKIHNHNIDYDYVNFLLNDVGDTTFYHGSDGSFVQNHCPVRFFDFNEDGTVSLHVNPDGQPSEIKAIDDFLNSFLRSVPPESKDEFAMLAYQLYTSLSPMLDPNNTLSKEDLIDIFFDDIVNGGYGEHAVYLLAYLIRYEQANPEFAEQLKSLLEKAGLENASGIIDTVKGILNFRFMGMDFNDIYLALTSGMLPAGLLLDALADFLKRYYNIDLPVERLSALLKLLGEAGFFLNDINDIPGGGDVRVDDVFGTEDNGRVYPPCVVYADAQRIKGVICDLKRVSDSLSSIEEMFAPRMMTSCFGFGIGTLLDNKLNKQKRSLIKEKAAVASVTDSLGSILELIVAADRRSATLV